MLYKESSFGNKGVVGKTAVRIKWINMIGYNTKRYKLVVN